MRKAGHDVVIVPMYLPMFSDSEGDVDNAPIFCGAVNLYLKYRFPLLKKFPNWLLRVFDSPLILKIAARNAGSTRSAGMEGLTIDMLNGGSGIMADEVTKLVQWLSKTEKPDVVHISNALLLGIAKRIKSELNVPIVCSLQDEHQWVDTMNAPFIEKVWDLIAEKSKDVDTFIAVSEFYAEKMQKRLNIPKEKLKVVHIGIQTDDYPEKQALPDYRAIGYLSKIAESLGFGILAEAFLLLKAEERYTDLRLYASGGMTSDNLKFIKTWQKKIAKAGFADDFIIEPEFDRSGRIDLLKKISLLSVPVPGGEAFGTYLLEAMAAGVPVVQPDEGGFTEIIRKTGGGVVYSPNNPETLAKTLDKLLADQEEMTTLSENAGIGVRKHFDISNFVNDTLGVYRIILEA